MPQKKDPGNLSNGPRNLLRKIFLDHPQTVDENYIQHFFVAMSFSVRLSYACFVCFVHAFLPCLFTRSGSQMISTLYDEMVASRNRRGHKHSEPGSQPI